MSKPNILFLGTHGQRNWGDELLLETFLYNLRAEANEFFVNSATPLQTAEEFKQYDINTFHTTDEKFKIIYNLLRSKYLVFGGGSIVKELNSKYGGETYSTLIKLKTLTSLAKLFGKKVIFSNIGIGPIDTDKGLQLAEEVLNKTDLLAVRDVESVNYSKKMSHLKVSLEQVPDAVFSLSREYFQLPTSKQSNIKSIKDIKTLVVNLCRNIDNPDNWDYFLDSLVQNLHHLIEQNPNLQIVGLPMQWDTPTNDDAKVLEELKQKLLTKYPELNFTVAKPQSTKEIAQILDSADIVLSERLHLLILCTILNKPYVALEYNIKVTGLLQDLQLEQIGVKICETFPQTDIFDKLNYVAENYSNLTKHLDQMYQELHKKDLEYFARVRAILK